jgi:hypothetical protein
VKLFISYRRQDTDDLAGRLCDRLTTEFGAENIFKDVDSISPGQNWKVALEQSVGGCDVVIALIGKTWATCVDAKGRRRLMNEDDMVRFELESANRTQRLVMPILVKGAPVPRFDELPESLHWLPDIHVAEIRGDPFFKDDVARVVSDLRRMRDRLAEEARVSPRAPGAPAAGAELGGASILCANCRRTCPRTDQFCEGCGAALWEVCPRCHSPVPAGQRFCKSCGADVPRARKADAAYEAARARFNELEFVRGHADRLRRVGELTGEVEAALRTTPEHGPTADLRRQLQRIERDATLEAAAAEFAGNRFGQALHYYQRLAELGAAGDEVTARVNFIRDYRDQALGEATALVARGSHKQAAAVLAPLCAAFPDDAPIKQAYGNCQQVIERASQLLSSGIRELRGQGRWVQVERELDWLRAQNIRADKLSELAVTAREKISSANATAAKASSALGAGNLQAAAQLARDVLAVVSDHEAAAEVARSCAGAVDRVAQLEEFVELGRWCAANDLVREQGDTQYSDPRIARLRARTEAAVAGIDFNIRLFAALAAGCIAVGYFGVPRLAAAVTLPEGAGENFFHYAWLVSSGLLLSFTWWVFEDKSEILRRVFSFFWRRGSRARDEAGTLAPGGGPLASVSDPAPPSANGPGPAEAQRAAVAVGPSVMPLVATPGAPATAEGQEPPTAPDLSATEQLQRMESTAVAAEWLLLGGLAFWLSIVVHQWLIRRLGGGWWTPPLWLGVVATVLIPVALYVGGFSKWRVMLGAGVACVVTAVGGALALPAGLSALVTWCLCPAFVGLLSAAIFKVPLWRGAAAALGGPVGGLLVGSPVIAGFLALTGLIVSPEAWDASAPAALPFVSAAVVWCTLVVLGSTASETLFKHLVVNHPVVRGVCALGLALATASAACLLVLVFGLLLNEKWMWVTSWVVLFAAFQPVPALIRWQWRSGFSVYSAAAALATIGVVLLVEWLSPVSSSVIAAWVVVCAMVVLLNVRTVDVFTRTADVLKRLRTRIRMRRLPVRIEVTRS